MVNGGKNMTTIEQILDALGDHSNKYIIEYKHEQWWLIDYESGNGEHLKDFLERSKYRRLKRIVKVRKCRNCANKYSVCMDCKDFDLFTPKTKQK